MEKIIIDCDPGHDDAVALMLATRAANLEILGVTVVAGNSALEHTLQNAIKILAASGARDVPVYAGCMKPMTRELLNRSGAQIHGEDGLGNMKIDGQPGKVQQENAVDYLIRTLCSSDEKITLVCLGPLTNIATAFLRYPACKEKVERLIVMGGAVYAPGNVNTAAEFNFFIDPEAARIVLASGCEVYLNALDVTMQALFYPEDIDEMAGSESALMRLAGDLLRLYAGSYERELGFCACPVHDALCIGVLMRPSLVTYEKVPMDISVEGITAGESVVDYSRQWPENVWLSRKIDRDGFVRLLKDALPAPRAGFVV